MPHSHSGRHHHGHGQTGRGSGHRGHVHARGDERRLLWALLLTGSFMGVELVGGLLSGSLALIADAGHMLTDTAALGLAWYAARLARRPPDPRQSYGYHRFQVLAAFVNGATLIGMAAWIVIEAVERLFAPVEVLGGVMLAVAAVGLVVNILAFLVLHGGSQGNLNIRGAVLHVLGDLLGSVAALAAAAVILATGWTPIDPLLSVGVAFLILRGALAITRSSWHVLMEGTPEGLDVELLKRDLAEAVPGVLDIHHVHVWALTPERPLVTLHARITDAADSQTILHRLQEVLADRFDLPHATIQIERGRCTEDRNATEPGEAVGQRRGL